MTPQEEEEFRRLAALPNVYDVISRSIAPSIFGGTDMKKAIACLLFGGSRKRWESRLSRSGEGTETWPAGRQPLGGRVLNVLFLSPGPAVSALLLFPGTFPSSRARCQLVGGSSMLSSPGTLPTMARDGLWWTWQGQWGELWAQSLETRD